MAATKTTWKGALLALLLGLVFTVAIAEVAVRIAMPQWREFYAQRFTAVDAVPGVGFVGIGKPGFDGYFAQNNGDFRVRIRINAFGLRNDEPIQAADGRVWIVGDSMAFGWGVERDETYTAVIAQETGLPTYNVASPGTDACGYQTLVARMPEAVAPRAVIVGLILENDVHVYDCAAQIGQIEEVVAGTEAGPGLPSSVTELKLLLTARSALYNVIAVAAKRMGVVREALADLGLIAREHTYSERVGRDDMAAVVRSTAAAVADLRDRLPPGTPFAVLVAPTRFEIRDRHPLHTALREQMVAALAAEGLDVIDPLPGFLAAGFAPTHFAHDGHWSPTGHRIAGEAVAAWMKDALR